MPHHLRTTSDQPDRIGSDRNRRADRREFLALVLSASMAGVAAGQPEYRVVRLTPEYTTNPFAESRAMGINALGVVVGAATVDLPVGTSVERAFVWLPDDVYGGYPFEHLVPLTHPTPDDPDGTSEARDVNDRGEIVGKAAFDGTAGAARAFYFQIGPAYGIVPGEMVNLGTLGTAPLSDSEAFAITEPYLISDGASGFIERVTVVGTTDELTYCNRTGFSWSPDTGMVAFDPPNVQTPGGGSSLRDADAFGVTPLRLGTTLRAVGRSTNCSSSVTCPVFDGRRAAIYWDGGSLTPSELPADEFRDFSDPPSTDGYLAAAFDVNDSLQQVGYVGGGLNGCQTRAYFWGGTGSTPILLPNPPGGAAIETEARAINASAEIVGLDTQNNLAIKWTTSQASYLDSLVDLSQIPLQSIQIAEAINDNGWIAGTARLQGVPVLTEGIVLIPAWDCPEDINRDGVVDQLDIRELQVATAAGGCLPRRICRADVNANNAIDNGDKAALLAALGTTCGGFTSSLSTPDAQLWLDLGGDQYLTEGGDPAAAAIEGAYASDPAETLINLITLLWE